MMGLDRGKLRPKIRFPKKIVVFHNEIIVQSRQRELEGQTLTPLSILLAFHGEKREHRL